jgi:hypothetical protein
MEKYAFLLGVVGMGVVVIAVSFYLYQRRRSQPGTERTWLSYVLVLPLVLDADKDKRGGRLLTNREWLGWGIVLSLIILGIVFAR